MNGKKLNKSPVLLKKKAMEFVGSLYCKMGRAHFFLPEESRVYWALLNRPEPHDSCHEEERKMDGTLKKRRSSKYAAVNKYIQYINNMVRVMSISGHLLLQTAFFLSNPSHFLLFDFLLFFISSSTSRLCLDDAGLLA